MNTHNVLQVEMVKVQNQNLTPTLLKTMINSTIGALKLLMSTFIMHYRCMF